MEKYVISSGLSVISDIKDNHITTTTLIEDAIQFNRIGDAMKQASEINKILGHSCYKVMSIIPVSGNL